MSDSLSLDHTPRVEKNAGSACHTDTATKRDKSSASYIAQLADYWLWLYFS